MGDLNLFCERMRYWCEVADLGYDQTQRWTIYNGGETDCSALVIHCLQEAGFDTGNASYTGDLRDNLAVRGWDILIPAVSEAIPGDILLQDEHHVAAVVSGYGWGAQVAEAWTDEKGGIYYGQAGDQTGLETRVRDIYSYPWWCILRYNEEDDMTPDDLLYRKIATADSGNITVWEALSWAYTYAKKAAASIEALSAAVETLAATKEVDGNKIVTSVNKAVDAKLKAIAIPEIDYDALGAAVAKDVPGGASADEIAKATASELYKRLKA